GDDLPDLRMAHDLLLERIAMHAEHDTIGLCAHARRRTLAEQQRDLPEHLTFAHVGIALLPALGGGVEHLATTAQQQIEPVATLALLDDHAAGWICPALEMPDDRVFLLVVKWLKQRAGTQQVCQQAFAIEPFDH